MKTHTPGPWTVSPDWPFPDERGQLHDAVVKHFPDGTEALICSFEHSVYRDSQNPNARLIAASPDLLEAARVGLLELRQIHSYHYPKCEGGCPTEEAINLLDAAIRKAGSDE
jgi:hypothetical protein